MHAFIHLALIMFRTILLTFIVLAGALAVIGASVVLLFGRTIEMWELLVCGSVGLIGAKVALGLYKRRERRRIQSLRDSALW